MADFVLVHGAWHGGWCWNRLEPLLHDAGHRTHAVTLTGLGERSHLLSRDITPDVHVQDVVNTILWRDLYDVVLVGHSYGGMVITGVASEIPERISSMVYLDAVVPDFSGESLFGRAQPKRMARFQAQMDEGAVGLLPDAFDAWSDDPATLEWLKAKCTKHPVGCMNKGVTLSGREDEVVRKLFILATRYNPSLFWGEYEKVKDRSGWTVRQIDSKHDVMVEKPEELAGILDAFAVNTTLNQ